MEIGEEEQKTCTKCKVLKPVTEFYMSKYLVKNGTKSYREPSCKDCRRALFRARAKKRDLKKHAKQMREFRRRRKLGIPYARQTHAEMIAVKTKYSRRRYRTDASFKLKQRLRCRLRNALKGKSKSQSTEKLLGICAEKCRKYIEEQFTEGMSWDTVVIDHIVPIASFENLSDPEQQRKCFHFTNLQPMFPLENGKKGAKMTPQAAQRVWDGKKWTDSLNFANSTKLTTYHDELTQANA